MSELLRNKKGMTLMELIVGILIFSVIAISVTAVLAPVLKAYSKANDLAEINVLLDNLSAEVLSDLSEATDVTISGTTLTIKTGKSTAVYDVSAGLLCKGDSPETMTPVLAQGYYKGKTVDVQYCDEDGDEINGKAPPGFLVRVTLLSSDGGMIASRDYAAMPLGYLY